MQSSRPYLSHWVHRTRRHLASSGRLSQLALLLSRRDGRHPGEWSRELRSILGGQLHPSLDLITEIDTLIAAPRPPRPIPSEAPNPPRLL